MTKIVIAVAVLVAATASATSPQFHTYKPPAALHVPVTPSPVKNASLWPITSSPPLIATGCEGIV